MNTIPFRQRTHRAVSSRDVLCLILVKLLQSAAPLTINGATVDSTKFMGVQITENLSWCENIASLVRGGQQRLYFLRKLRQARVPASTKCTFNRGIIESILSSCITVWYDAMVNGKWSI